MTIRRLLRSTPAGLLVLALVAAHAVAQQDAAAERQPDKQPGSKPEATTDGAPPAEVKPSEATPGATKPDTTKPDTTKPGETPPVEEGTPAEQFAKTLAQWRDLEAKIKIARELFLATPPTERGTALAEHNALVDEIVKLLPTLRDKAMAAYKAAPNEDPQIVRLLVGMMVNANLHDAYDDAVAIGKLLDEHKCAEPAYHGQLGAALHMNGKTDEAAPHLLAAEADEKTQTSLVKYCLDESKRLARKKAAEAALAAYKAEPNADPKLVPLLVGAMHDANREERHAEARDIGVLLEENKSPDVSYRGELGAALFCLGEFEKAAPHLKAAEAAGQADTAQLPADLVKLCLDEMNLREAEAAADNLPRVRLTTSKGEVVVELFENEAPGTVGNFISLVEAGKYDGLLFHRVIDGFVAQGGDPSGDGTGGPGYQIYCECYKPDHRKHFRGSLSMAHSGRDTAGSQFFITFVRTAGLDGLHTVFGRVIEGMEHVDALNRTPLPTSPRDKIVKAEVLRKRDHAYAPVKVSAAGPPTQPPPPTETKPPAETKNGGTAPNTTPKETTPKDVTPQETTPGETTPKSGEAPKTETPKPESPAASTPSVVPEGAKKND